MLFVPEGVSDDSMQDICSLMSEGKYAHCNTAFFPVKWLIAVDNHAVLCPRSVKTNLVFWKYQENSIVYRGEIPLTVHSSTPDIRT